MRKKWSMMIMMDISKIYELRDEEDDNNISMMVVYDMCDEWIELSNYDRNKIESIAHQLTVPTDTSIILNSKGGCNHLIPLFRFKIAPPPDKNPHKSYKLRETSFSLHILLTIIVFYSHLK